MLAEAVDARMLALVRCVLAFSAFAVVCVNPTHPYLADLTRISLALYSGYSAILLWHAAKSGWPRPARALHWIDVFFYVFLATLTDGTSSIFFSFFLFSILVASFTWGFGEGLAVSVASLAAFTAVGVLVAPMDPDFELDRALIRGVYLFVFGYMISYWGGYESLLKRRLALLNEINNGWTPRFGVDHVIATNLDRLRNFYDAQACVLVLQHATSAPSCVMYRSLHEKPADGAAPIAVTGKAVDSLLQLPDTLAAIYHMRDGILRDRLNRFVSYDMVLKIHSREHVDECRALANLLDTSVFITVPYLQRDGARGRLYVAGGKRRFDQSDIEFLAQLSAALATVVENISLMEELVSRASEQERLKISRDLHDTTVQPYIGLKMALDALQREAGADNSLAARLAELNEMAGMTIRDLRDYTATFKDKSSMPAEFLLAAIRKQADRLQRFYSINVRVDTNVSFRFSGRIADEAFHIVSEAFSNVLRHTATRDCYVSLNCVGPRLDIAIGNEAAQAAQKPGFMPRSIHERVQSLGGNTVVERDADGYTVVRISIPL